MDWSIRNHSHDDSKGAAQSTCRHGLTDPSSGGCHQRAESMMGCLEARSQGTAAVAVAVAAAAGSIRAAAGRKSVEEDVVKLSKAKNSVDGMEAIPS